MDTVTINGNRVTIDRLDVEDASLADLLRLQLPDRHADTVARALAVGARGLVSMGLGIDLNEVDDRVRRTVTAVTSEARNEVETLLRAAAQAFDESFSPDHRSSAVGRALAEFSDWRDRFLEGMNPSYADSHTARFLDRLAALVGPHGELEQRLTAMLDPQADDSALSRLHQTIDERFTELRDVLMIRHGRDEEAEAGTRKGFEYEELVEEWLRSVAAGVGGSIVERTGRTGGGLSSESVVGDFVVTLPDGARIVVEAKNTARISLRGKDGILDELDRAVANRSADYAICLSANDAFPKEVGTFGVYGRRLLAVAGGDGTLATVALRWAIAQLAAEKTQQGVLDVAAIEDRLQRIRQLAQLLSSNRRSLTEIATSVERVRSSLEHVRTELLALVADLGRETGTGEAEGRVVDLRQAADTG
jgi:hypothetical protein